MELSERKKIAIVAACDRNNYGDVLLPKLFREYIKSQGLDVDCFIFGMVRRNLVTVGGDIVYSKNDIDETYDWIVIAGGEVLSAQYTNMYLNLQTKRGVILFVRFINRFSYTLANAYCKWRLKGINSLPWSIFSQTDKQKIVYNCVGGRTIYLKQKQKKEIERLVSNCEFFSVRDSITFDQLKRFVKHSIDLIPDTAIIMSEVFSYGDITSSCTLEIIEMFKTLHNYIVVQMNDKYGTEIIDETVKAINDYITCGYKVVLLPIGRAQGHDDIIPLKKIYNNVANESCYLIENNSVFDVMYIISGSVAYIGTSLHGLITAAAYEIPHTAITSKAWKIIGYLNTWNTSTISCLNGYNEMRDYICNGKYQDSVNHETIKRCKVIVNEYLERIIDRIKAEN